MQSATSVRSPLSTLVCEVADELLRALSSCTALTSLDLRWCFKVTAAGVQALRSTTVAPSLRIIWF